MGNVRTKEEIDQNQIGQPRISRHCQGSESHDSSPSAPHSVRLDHSLNHWLLGRFPTLPFFKEELLSSLPCFHSSIVYSPMCVGGTDNICFISHWTQRSVSRPDGKSRTSCRVPDFWAGVIHWIGFGGHLPWGRARDFLCVGTRVCMAKVVDC